MTRPLGQAYWYSEEGIRIAWRDEAAFRQELVLMLALAPLTSTPEFNALAAKAKDCGSAAVFVALLTLGGAWLALAGPALWSRMGY